MPLYRDDRVIVHGIMALLAMDQKNNDQQDLFVLLFQKSFVPLFFLFYSVERQKKNQKKRKEKRDEEGHIDSAMPPKENKRGHQNNNSHSKVRKIKRASQK